MRCWIELSKKALVNNYKLFESISKPGTFVPVIKSNAYGHGLAEVFEILNTLEPEIIAVNYVEEAQELRQLGFKKRILIVGPVPQNLYPQVQEIDAEFFLGDQFSVNEWLTLETKPKAHIKVDTGMSRQGFHPHEVDDLSHQLKKHKKQIIGIASHFSNVEDVMELSYAHTQVERFHKATKTMEEQGFKLTPHMASSASTLLMDHMRVGLTRVGISLYGLWPSQATKLSYLKNHKELEDLRPVLNWKTEVALVKTIQAGDFIGYGCTYRAMTDMNVAVLPVGYYEGYPRLASGRGSYVLIKGKRCPIVGRICMNMMTVDITSLDKIQTGEVVTLIGKDQDEIVDADTFAGWAETIHYEALTCLNAKIPRRIIDDC